jgi:hypothetical protein
MSAGGFSKGAARSPLIICLYMLAPRESDWLRSTSQGAREAGATLMGVNLRAWRDVAPPTLAIMSEEAFREMWPNGDHDAGT